MDNMSENGTKKVEKASKHHLKGGDPIEYQADQPHVFILSGNGLLSYSDQII